MKYTIKHARSQLARLNAALGTNYTLERSPSVSGHLRIVKGVDASNIFGLDCYSARELYHLINFALRAIQIRERGDEYAAYWPKDKV